MAQFSLIVSSADDLAYFDLIGDDRSLSVGFVDDGGTPAIRYNKLHNSHAAYVLKDVSAASEIDFYCRNRIGTQGSSRRCGICVRATADAAYVFGGQSSTTRQTILSSTSEYTVVNTLSDQTNIAEYHWSRLRVVGSTVYAKDWAGSLEDEPPAWEVEYVHGSPYGAGKPGLWARATLGDAYIYVTELYVGTDGDPAPTGPVESEPEPLLWLPSQFRRMAIAGAGAGVGPSTHSASGALTAGSAQVAGTARLLKTHAASGTLAAGSATVDSAASRSEPASTTHTASGALAAGSAQVDGAALRFAVHSASGVLEAGAAQVDGAALRVVPVHTASGALAAGAATVSGTARRYATHTASGALIAGSAIVVGEAAKFAIHATDGTLTAGSATVSGAARVLKTHTASGVLTAGAATIAGTAGNAGTLTLTPADIQAVADAVWADPRALTVAKFLGLK